MGFMGVGGLWDVGADEWDTGVRGSTGVGYSLTSLLVDILDIVLGCY